MDSLNSVAVNGFMCNNHFERLLEVIRASIDLALPSYEKATQVTTRKKIKS